MSNMLSRDFSRNPTNIDIQRSRFNRDSNHKTTITEGDLVPIFVDEVLPGDTFSMDTSFLIRMATPIYPVMDNANIDIYYFFVPNRLVWDHWQEFCGENTSAPWAQTTEYTVPQIRFDIDYTNFGFGAQSGSVMNYIGVPTRLVGPQLKVSDLPNRAYRLIWNEFFRDENLQYPVPVYTDDSTRSYKDSYYSQVSLQNDYGGRPLKVSKYHDYFTSCLPAPQKGDSVTISLGDKAPVVSGPLHRVGQNARLSFQDYQITGSEWSQAGLGVIADGNRVDGYKDYILTTDTMYQYDPTSTHSLFPNNMWTDLSSAIGASVNELRQAFAVQRLFERDARGGTRYRELLRSHFGVISPDSRVQVPEYLGGCRVPINMDQVLQTSSTDQVSPQGNTAAYSMTTARDSSFTKSFVEHGLLIGLACIRVEHSYCQGVERFLSRKRRFDYYYPALANISEQPVYVREIRALGLESSQYPDRDDDNVFGYQEAWADYRYKPNRLSGGFSEEFVQDSVTESHWQQSSLASAWTYSDYYTQAPYLSESWIKEGSSNIGNTLAVTDPSYPQFICDFYFKLNCVRPMPMYSIPGLIDHH